VEDTYFFVLSAFFFSFFFFFTDEYNTISWITILVLLHSVIAVAMCCVLVLLTIELRV
jgi:hypothetical protein